MPDTPYWVQVVPGTVNLSYPFADDPAEHLLHIGMGSNSLQLVDWQAAKYAKFNYSAMSNMELAKLVDRIFVMLFGCDDNTYEVDTSLERL